MKLASLGSPDTEPVRLPDAVVRRGRRKLLLLAFVCVLPVLASYLMFYLWQPSGRVNHGTLLTPAALPERTLAGLAGQPALTAAELRERWTLVVVAGAACTPACERALYVARQSRIAQGQEMERVGRLWLVADAGELSADDFAARFGAHEDLRAARAEDGWLAHFPAAHDGAIFLVDPLGNVMMRFDDQADAVTGARELTKDLQRLLKYSALGRGGQP